jgi:glycosyltransferase involved in cell wall biosynthesis
MDISVVIPLFNKGQVIARTIDSVLNQTLPASEIVIINDGSIDNSAEIVAALARNNLRIKLHSQNNLGASFARNRGVELAKFEHIAFLDADDEWKPDFLIHIQRLYNNFPDCGAYATAYEVVEENGSRYFPPLIGVPPAPWIGIIPNLFKMMQDGSPFYT